MVSRAGDGIIQKSSLIDQKPLAVDGFQWIVSRAGYVFDLRLGVVHRKDGYIKML